MKAFEYAAPRSETEILEMLSPDAGKTEILAGGTDLVGLMEKMIVTPDRVVNIMNVPELKTIEPQADGSVRIGAAVTLDDVAESPYLEDYRAILQAIAGINSMQLQAQGTIGGEICQRPRCWFFRSGRGLMAEDGLLVAQGDNRFHAILGNSGPSKFVSGSRIAPALIALQAKLRVIGPETDDEMLLPVEDFYRTPRHAGQRENVLLPKQVVTHIVLPPATGSSATYEVRQSVGPDYPLASAAAMLQMSGGVVQNARIVLGFVAPTPWISVEAASTLRGLFIDQTVAEAAGKAAVRRATPLKDNRYKVQLAQVAVKRAVLLAAGLETGGF